MDKLVSYCGLSCQTCPVHLATMERDEARRKIMRTSIAEQCARQYGMDLLLEDITDCDGCKTMRLFSGCRDCQIRTCAISRKLDSCAFCADYPCEELKKHFRLDPSAEKRLDKIRRTITAEKL